MENRNDKAFNSLGSTLIAEGVVQLSARPLTALVFADQYKAVSWNSRIMKQFYACLAARPKPMPAAWSSAVPQIKPTPNANPDALSGI